MKKNIKIIIVKKQFIINCVIHLYYIINIFLIGIEKKIILVP